MTHICPVQIYLKHYKALGTDGREYDIATNSNSYLDNDRYTITHGAFVDYTAEFTGNENISKFELGVGIVFNNRYVHLQDGRIFSYRNSNIPLLFTYGNEVCADGKGEESLRYNDRYRQEWIDSDAKECGTDTNIYGTEFNFEIFNTYGADLGVRINDVYSTVRFNDIAFRESQYVNDKNQALVQAEVFIYIKSISYVTENVPTLDVARVSPSVDTTNLDYLTTFARFTEFQNQTKAERFAAIEQLEEANQWVVNRTANDGTTTSYYFSWDFENCLELYPEGELNNVSQLAIDTNIASGQVKCWAAVDDSFLDRLKYQQYISFFVPLELDEENTGFTSLAAQYYYYLLFPITAVADIFNRTAFENYNEEICVFKKNYKIDNNTDEVYSHLSTQELEVFNGLGDLVGLLCIDVAEIREEYRKEHFYNVRRFIEELDILFLSPLLIILLIIQIIKRKRT